MVLSRRYKKGISGREVVAGFTLHEFSAPTLDEIQLVLRVRLLRVVAAWRIQLRSHAAAAQDFHEPLTARAR